MVSILVTPDLIRGPSWRFNVDRRVKPAMTSRKGRIDG
jgi:hypothetical protein